MGRSDPVPALGFVSRYYAFSASSASTRVRYSTGQRSRFSLNQCAACLDLRCACVVVRGRTSASIWGLHGPTAEQVRVRSTRGPIRIDDWFTDHLGLRRAHPARSSAPHPQLQQALPQTGISLGLPDPPREGNIQRSSPHRTTCAIQTSVRRAPKLAVSTSPSARTDAVYSRLLQKFPDQEVCSPRPRG